MYVETTLAIGATAVRLKRWGLLDPGRAVITASGICDAGRVQYDLRDNLSRMESSLLMIRYQSSGALGRRLAAGEAVHL